MDIKVDELDKDIKFDGSGDFEKVFDLDDKKQIIRITLLLNLGEWFLNPTIGFNRETVQKKQWSEDEIRGAIYEALEDVGDVDEVETIRIDFDNTQREMTIDLTVLLDNGDRLTEQVVI